MIKALIISVLVTLNLGLCAFANNADITLLQEGRKALENGQYEEALNCIGQILEKSGDVSYDSKVLALHRAIQAYGMIRLKDHSYDKAIEDNLSDAIAQDPSWEYPKKLLEQFRNSKDL